MSRAFVKEPDGDDVPDDVPRLVQSPHPNLVTPRGYAALCAQRDAAVAARAAAPAEVLRDKRAVAVLDRKVAFLEERVRRAIVTEPPAEATDEVRFGATVRVAEPAGSERAFTIVGEDEADPAAGLISWVAPLAHAVLGAHEGDVVTWARPDGALEIEILEVSYTPSA